ncbi:hypothetical protein DV092_04595 [Clostridium botulinum]|uniref:hypothetical protein n=1 Tax=Clostridium sp. ZBS13 TaxID=2949971 RepID=UPI002079B9D8|nr:hypothetical protein [Clostridium sp. ZBS13]MBN1039363.1 hypothetical protein [Clostridium botulinum]MBN1051333.1 hypothetical protein [Clostridium botulinum]
MKMKTFLIAFLISTIAFTQIPKAIFTSNIYKQGIYDISEVLEFNATAKLLTPRNVTSLSITDSNGNQKFYKRFDTIDEIINLGTIKEGDVISIIGKGEIAITRNE